MMNPVAADRSCRFYPTPGSAITIPETAHEFAIKGNHLTPIKGNQFDGRTKTDPHKHIHESKNWRYVLNTEITENEAEMLRNCHGHNLFKGNIIKSFYHGLSEITQEVRNTAAGGIFLYKTPNQAYQKTVAFADEGSSNTDTDKIMARIDAMTIKMDAQYKELQSRAKQPTPNLDDDDMPMSCEEAKFMQTFSRNEHVNAVFTRSGKSYNPPNNPDDQQNNSENPINFDSDDEDDEPTPQPKTQPTKTVKETPLPKPYKPKIL
ncbi:hypothetical protein Tco_1037316 [Tanacetum coccineum]